MAAFISPIATLANSILDRVLPDKAANDAAKNQLAEMVINGQIQQMAGQLQIDNTEAASKFVFVAGWRPFIGWICGAGIGYEMILRPLLSFVVLIFHGHFAAPAIETQDLIGLVGTLLGMATLRTVDKTQGTGNGH